MPNTHEYKARVRVENGVEETQFAPVSPDSPRIPTRYVTDPEEFGKFKNGRTYKRDPEKAEAELEEVVALVQEEQAKEAVEVMTPPKTSKKTK